MKNASLTTIGLDLGDRRSHVCVLDDKGAVVTRTEVATTRPSMTKFFRASRAPSSLWKPAHTLAGCPRCSS